MSAAFVSAIDAQSWGSFLRGRKESMDSSAEACSSSCAIYHRADCMERARAATTGPGHRGNVLELKSDGKESVPQITGGLPPIGKNNQLLSEGIQLPEPLGPPCTQRITAALGRFALAQSWHRAKQRQESPSNDQKSQSSTGLCKQSPPWSHLK